MGYKKRLKNNYFPIVSTILLLVVVVVVASVVVVSGFVSDAVVVDAGVVDASAVLAGVDFITFKFKTNRLFLFLFSALNHSIKKLT